MDTSTRDRSALGMRLLVTLVAALTVLLLVVPIHP
jgi:hypothetical protein